MGITSHLSRCAAAQCERTLVDHAWAKLLSGGEDTARLVPVGFIKIQEAADDTRVKNLTSGGSLQCYLLKFQ